MSAENISRRKALGIGLRAGALTVGLNLTGWSVLPEGSVVAAFPRTDGPAPSPEVMDLGMDHIKQQVRGGIKDLVDLCLVDSDSPRPLEKRTLRADSSVNNGEYVMVLPTSNKETITISITSAVAYYRGDASFDNIRGISIDLSREGEDGRPSESYAFFQDPTRDVYSVFSPQGIFSNGPKTNPEDNFKPLTEERVTTAFEGANKLINLVLPR